MCLARKPTLAQWSHLTTLIQASVALMKIQDCRTQLSLLEDYYDSKVYNMAKSNFSIFSPSVLQCLPY